MTEILDMLDYATMLDIALASLLLITILYCWRLDQRLKNFRAGKDGMLQAAQELQSAVTDAERAVSELRKSATEAGHSLQTRINEARAVAEAPPPKPASDYALRRRSAV